MILAAPASGALVGFSLGLVGGGGSILATPLLVYVVGVAQPHVAIGTAALAASVNAFVNLIGHARAGNVRWRYSIVFAVVGILGALAGSTVGKLVDGARLLFLFALAMLAVGATMLRPRREHAALQRTADFGTWLLTATVALTAGLAASGFFGIGGGVLIVPGLVLATNMPMVEAVGSSLLAVGAFALATALNYALSGLVDWRLAGEFISGGIVGGALGMTLSNRLSTSKNALNRILAMLIFMAAASVLYRSGHTLMG